MCRKACTQSSSQAMAARSSEFPQHFSFRITASLKKFFLMSQLRQLMLPDDPHELLLHLKFRVRVYHGLEVREIVPQSIEMIGAPADVASDERDLSDQYRR